MQFPIKNAHSSLACSSVVIFLVCAINGCIVKGKVHPDDVLAISLTDGQFEE
jgi:hypothetical protein